MSVSIYRIESGWICNLVHPTKLVVCLKRLLTERCVKQSLTTGLNKIRCNKAERSSSWELTDHGVCWLWTEQAECRGTGL